jgi:SAM-dependent methyltransferase
MVVGQSGKLIKHECRYCNFTLISENEFSFGKIPMTPNAIETGELLKNGKYFEYNLEIIVCKNCGLIQQLHSPDPDILYFRFKNQHVGKLWEKHYDEFSSFILTEWSKDMNILEIGAGDLKLANILVKNKISRISVVEKNIIPEKLNNKIKFYEGFLEDISFSEKYDLVYSSHVFEHIDVIEKHFKKIVSIMNKKGKIIISFPDFEYWISNFYLNSFSQEHPIFPLIDNVRYLFSKFGFEITKIQSFENHSLFISAELNNPSNLINPKNIYQKNYQLVQEYFNKFKKFNIFLKKEIKNKKIYVFGANSGTQILLKKILPNSQIEGILDNASIKQKKQLYGFNHVVYTPEILYKLNNFKDNIVLVFTGAYVQEIKEQIKSINEKISILTINDFFEILKKD